MKNDTFLLICTITSLVLSIISGINVINALNITNNVKTTENTASIMAFNEKNAEIAKLKEEKQQLDAEYSFTNEFQETRCWCVPYASNGYRDDKLDKKTICDYKEWDTFVNIGE